MTPPTKPEFDLAAACQPVYRHIAKELRAKGVLQLKFPNLTVNDWSVFSYPGLMGNNLDGSTARFTFTLSGYEGDLNEAEATIKAAPHYIVMSRTGLVMYCCSPLCCVRDFANQNELRKFVDSYVLGPFTDAK